MIRVECLMNPILYSKDRLFRAYGLLGSGLVGFTYNSACGISGCVRFLALGRLEKSSD